MTEIWPLVRIEREALIADLARLSPEDWARPSLCDGWSVHDVAAHLVDNAKATWLGIVGAMIRARFDFDRQNEQGMRRGRGDSPHETLERLRAVADRRTGPPAPVDSRLVEEVLHGEDIRRPLGIVHAYEPEAVTRSLAYQARTSVGLGGGRQIAATVGLRAADADVTLGEGPEIHGPALSLLMVISGRTVALDDLEGPGVPVLRSRS